MELNETELHNSIGKVFTQMGPAANEPLTTIDGFNKLGRATENTFLSSF